MEVPRRDCTRKTSSWYAALRKKHGTGKVAAKIQAHVIMAVA
jgi:hypothetical protein